MADDFSFGDLASMFGGDTGGYTAPSGGGFSFEDTNLNVPTVMPTGGGAGDQFGFGDVAKTVGEGGKALAGGIKDVLSPIAGVAGAVAPIAQLGTAGMGIASGIQGAKTSAANAATARRGLKLQEQVAGQQQAAAAPLTEFGKKQLDAASAGQVQPAIEAQIQQWLQGARQHAQDYAARSGQGNSVMLTQWLNWLDQQAQAMRASALQEQEKLGISGLAQGAQSLGGAGQTAGNIQAGAQNQSQAIAQLMEQANRALSSLSAGASG